MALSRLKRPLPQRDEITTLAVGTSHPDTGIFTLRLSEPVLCGPGEELTMELNMCRVPPAADEEEEKKKDEDDDDEETLKGDDEEDDVPPEEPPGSHGLYFWWSLELQDGSMIHEDAVPLDWRSDLTNYNHFVDILVQKEGVSDLIRDNVVIIRNTGVIFDDDMDSEAEEVYGEKASGAIAVLNLSDDLRAILDWPQVSYSDKIPTKIPKIAQWHYTPPVEEKKEKKKDVKDPPPRPSSLPHRFKEPVNLFIEGVETALCEKGELKPFVSSLLLDAYMGGTVPPRPYHAPLRWRNWSCHEIKTLDAYVEDDDGNVMLFDPGSILACEITWRAWTRDSPEIADELEGHMVVTFEGSEGQWDMGGTRDFSGVTRKDEEAPSYEVAVLSATVTMRPTPGLISIQAEDWLYPPCDLVTLPCGKGGNVFMFDPPVPHYKRIRPVPVDNTRFHVRPVYLQANPPAYEIISTKLVLRVRRCRTKLVPSCRGPSCSP